MAGVVVGADALREALGLAVVADAGVVGSYPIHFSTGCFLRVAAFFFVLDFPANETTHARRNYRRIQRRERFSRDYRYLRKAIQENGGVFPLLG